MFLCVKNKYCYTCARAKASDPASTPKKHECYLNYTGPSTGMEQQGIVDGFNASIEQHGLVYKWMVGDGDSSVYARVREKVSYGRYVEKQECANHVIRCYKDNLHKICSNTKLYPLRERKILKPLIDRITKGARQAIRHNKGNVEMLKRDLINGPHHVFGDHRHCRDYYCKKEEDVNLVPQVETSTVWKEVIVTFDLFLTV